jgi:hypothetical protein
MATSLWPASAANGAPRLKRRPRFVTSLMRRIVEREVWVQKNEPARATAAKIVEPNAR